jgi:hypothetical protein
MDIRKYFSGGTSSAPTLLGKRSKGKGAIKWPEPGLPMSPDSSPTKEHPAGAVFENGRVKQFDLPDFLFCKPTTERKAIETLDPEPEEIELSTTPPSSPKRQLQESDQDSDSSSSSTSTDSSTNGSSIVGKKRKHIKISQDSASIVTIKEFEKRKKLWNKSEPTSVSISAEELSQQEAIRRQQLLVKQWECKLERVQQEVSYSGLFLKMLYLLN